MILILFIMIFLQQNQIFELHFLNLSPLIQVQHVRAEEQEQGE